MDAIMMGLIYLVRIGAIAVALTTIGLLIVRWRRASRPQRRAVMPVVVAGAVAFAVLIASYGAAVLGAAMTVDLGRAAWFALAAVPVAVGFDPATTPKGTGLQGLADRLGALGGTIDITSPPAAAPS